MENISRPFFKFSAEQLEAKFVAQKHDPLLLVQLVQELSLRDTKKARTLLALVAAHLATFEIESDDATSEDGFDESDAPPPIEGQIYGPIDPPPLRAERQVGPLNSDQPPDDRQRPQQISRIRPVGTAGLRSPWIRPLNNDRSLDVGPNADLPEKYIAALATLIAEIKSTGNGQKRYELENGIRAEGNENIYQFSFSDEAELFEDAKIELIVLGRRVNGSIVSIGSGKLWLASDEDFGQTLPRATLLVDATALLEVLKQRIEDARSGQLNINRDLADAAVGAQRAPADPPEIPWSQGSNNLNPAQLEACKRSLRASVNYIWGPPGCGKTFVLGEIVRAALESNKRVLICSNTNKAVDQVIYRICQSLGTEHPAMDEGLIVRLGTISDKKLSSKYDHYVTIDGIVERRSADLKDRLQHAQRQLEALDNQCRSANVVLDQFSRLDHIEKELQSRLEAINTLVRQAKDHQSLIESDQSKLETLKRELETRRTATFTLFKRSERTILADVVTTQERKTKRNSEFENIRKKYDEAKAKFEASTLERDRLQASLSKFDRAQIKHSVKAAEDCRSPLVAEIRDIESKISDLRASVVKDAKILGATCTKAYLSAKDIGQMDMVIVDEASMVLLPMVWFVAGLAKERFVACGDFCQIPPIVPTSQRAVHDVLGHDVFTAAGLDNPGSTDPRMTMLDTQYRMNDQICALISGPMYSGRLRTGTLEKTGGGARPPAPYDGRLTIVDTSDLWPFESVNAFGSRFNLMHALLVRNMAWHFDREGYLDNNESLAVCTPYAAQSRLIGKLLETEGLGNRVQVGTVHRFQGDEKDAIILELPEGHGGAKMVGQFLQGSPPDQVGARLINVAVSRARSHLIVVANLTYLDRMLPSSALLRGILHNMQEKGRVISGTELLRTRPIERDLDGLFDRVTLDSNAKTIGVFNQSTFGPAIEADLVNAKQSIVIFSGFVTPARVAKIGDLLRTKAANGVKVRCVTRPPKLNGTMDPARTKNALDALERIKCSVDCRARIHEKIVLIDKEIVWLGSLNVLSHTHLTDESMTRIVSTGLASALAANLSKKRISGDLALATIDEAENPRCGSCGGRTVYDQSKFGAYFYCEDDHCDWRLDLKRMNGQPRRQNSSNTETSRNTPATSKDGPACPECGSRTMLRTGNRGMFYGCSRYPRCTGTTSVNPKRKS